MTTAGKYAKTSSRTLAIKELAVALRQHTVSHFLFQQGIFDQSNATVVPYAPYYYLLIWLKIKLRGRHFDTVEVIEAELQAVLNTLTDNDFQDAFKK
jgi:hypothetical protein